MYSYLILVWEACITYPHPKQEHNVLRYCDHLTLCFPVCLCCRPHHQSVGPGDRERVAVAGRSPQHGAASEVLSHHSDGLHRVPVCCQGVGHPSQPCRLSQNTQVLVCVNACVFHSTCFCQPFHLRTLGYWSLSALPCLTMYVSDMSQNTQELVCFNASNFGIGRDVRSLMLSIQHFLCQPQRCPPD